MDNKQFEEVKEIVEYLKTKEVKNIIDCMKKMIERQEIISDNTECVLENKELRGTCTEKYEHWVIING